MTLSLNLDAYFLMMSFFYLLEKSAVYQQFKPFNIVDNLGTFMVCENVSQHALFHYYYGPYFSE